jgi:hypothetical protein
MGVHEGRGMLARSVKELMLRWADTKAEWHDSVAQKFEEQYLQPAEREMRTATGAMDIMAQMLQQVKNDCR